MSEPLRIRSVTRAACALALGGRLLKQAEEHNLLVFYIEPPPGLDLDAPDLMVAVTPLLAWVESLAGRVRAQKRVREGGAQHEAGQ